MPVLLTHGHEGLHVVSTQLVQKSCPILPKEYIACGESQDYLQTELVQVAVIYLVLILAQKLRQYADHVLLQVLWASFHGLHEHVGDCFLVLKAV